MILWDWPRDMWCTSILHSGGLGRESDFTLCVLDGERVESRLYRRASNRYISEILAIVRLVYPWIIVGRIFV